MKLRLWGVRGSLPTPLSPMQVRQRLESVLLEYERQLKANAKLSVQDFLSSLPQHMTGGYGGNTMCGEVTHGKSRLIIDGGSGLRALYETLIAAEPEISEFHIYFTHFHWDHLLGLPFFPPMYLKGKTVHFYAVHDNLEASLRTLFCKPNFPVPYEVVRNQVRLHRLEPRKPMQIGELKVTPYQLDHPDPCWGPRVEAGGKALAWAVDTECTRLTHEEMGQDSKLYQGVNTLVFDAQYSFGEALEKINWGHASGPMGIDLALREGVKQVLFVHHDPAASDKTIREAEEQTRVYFEEILRARRNAGLKTADLNWRFAFEGEVIEI